jgi:serine/threonine-protein kinase RsbW
MADTWTWRAEATLPSETNAHQPILEELLDQLARHEFSSADIHAVHLAVEEAMVNAVKHGNGLESEKKVHVVCQVSKDRVRVEIEDEGPGFDPDQVPDPTEDINVEFPCGRGVMLMRKFMSKVEFNKAGNRVVMEKQRTSPD